MNLKIIDKDENELYLLDNDFSYLTSRFESLNLIFNTELIYIHPNQDLKNGMLFQGKQLKNNLASHYSFNSSGIKLNDSNNKIAELFKDDLKVNYINFIDYFQDICEKQPIFLNNKVDMNTIEIEWENDIESSLLSMRYFNNNKTVNNKSVNFKMPLKLIFENQKDIYRLVILAQLYKTHSTDFKDYTQDEFLLHAEDIFTQRKMLEY